MRRLSAFLVFAALLAAARVSNAQNVIVTADSSTAKGAATRQPTPDEALENLQKAAADLSKAVEVAVAKVANSPELRTAALQIAAGAVVVAQNSLAEQLKMIEAALNAAARQIAAAQAAQKAAPSGQTPSK